MNRIFRNTIFYLLIFLVIIGVVSFFNGSNQKTVQMRYDEFKQHLQEGDVTTVTLQPDGGVYSITGQLEGYDKDKMFVTHIPSNEKAVGQILSKFKKMGIDVKEREETSGWVTFFIQIIP
ncbi:MAG TPA: ATP-dependent metallopeptidase FtsH/Yme1/Tma family protein, partial [Bacillales bacterium]